MVTHVRPMCFTLIFGAVLLAVACSSIEENQPGNFSALGYGAKAPGLEGTTVASGACSAAPVMDAASTDASADTQQDSAEPPPLVPPPASPCATIFVQKIVPFLQMSCANCHKAPAGGSLNLSDDTATWRDDLVAAKTTSSLKSRYVEPCVTDPQQHAMYCNIADCNMKSKTGNPMPLNRGAATLSTDEKNALEQWVRCGSPK
jgi:hypothetical protein